MSTNPMIDMTSARAMLDTLTGRLASYFINIYTGSIPSNCAASEVGTQLAGLQFGGTAFPASTDGGSNGLATATANAITSDTSADASGTAGHFRLSSTDGGGTVRGQGTCGTSSADMILNTTAITAGDTVACSSFVITQPDGSGND